MKRFTLLLTALLLCAGGMTLRAETVTQSFNDMSLKGKITFTGSTVGTTDLVTYTCYGTGCKFGQNASSTGLYIRMLKTNDYVVISPALNHLKSIRMDCETTGDPKRILRVYVSEDGSTWSEALTDATSPMTGAVQVPIPEGYYYVKVARVTGTDIYIRSFMYEFDNCPSCYSYDY